MKHRDRRSGARLACAGLGLIFSLGAAGGAFGADPALGRDGDFTLDMPQIEEAATAHGFYLRLDGGSSYIAAGDGTFGPLRRHYGGGPGWSLGAGIGYHLLPQWRVDATVDVINHARLSETALMANLYWDFATFGRVTPYIGAGIGAGQITIDAAAPIAAVRGLDRTDWQMAWSLMAGLSWAITEQLTFNSGYRYLDFGTPHFNAPGRPFDLVMSAVQEHQFRIGLRYAFR